MNMSLMKTARSGPKILRSIKSSISMDLPITLGTALGLVLTLGILRNAHAGSAQAAPKKAGMHEWVLDTSHSSVGFEISHLVIATVDGRFKEFKGSFKADFEQNQIQDVTFMIKTASIDTADEKRDKHLRSGDFFNAKSNPTIEFKNAKVTFKGSKPAMVKGTLKMAGKEKPVELKIDWKGQVTDPWGNHKAVFNLEGELDRTDFGISWNEKLDKGGLMIGEKVKLRMKIEANRKG